MATASAFIIMHEAQFTDRCYFLVRFAYGGRGFFGVQEQPGRKTVLGTLRARIEATTKQRAHALVVSARTDRDVCAVKNYASFYVKMPLDVNALMGAVTVHRDDGLYAVAIKKTHSKCHARGNTGAKTYRYTIKDGTFYPNENAMMVWEVVPTLSLAAMRFASRDFLGTHDFSSVRGGGCEADSAIKEILFVDIWRTSQGYIFIEICGQGFLRKMMRNIVGLLVEIGAGLRPCDAVLPILLEKSRHAAGIMAPAQGLCLMNIECRADF